MPIQRRAPFALLVLTAMLLAAGKPPSTRALIGHAKAAVVSGTVDPARDLAPLLERLATTQDAADQAHLVRAIDSLGRWDSANPAAVKTYLRDNAPPVLLAIARSKAPSGLRSNALMALRSLNVSDSVLDEAIAIANAETGPDQHEIQLSGRLLADWKASRASIGAGAAPAAASTPAPASGAALELLRRRHVRVSAQSLGEAAGDADAELVLALLDAGVDVNATAAGGMTPLRWASGEGCVFAGMRRGGVEERLATLDVLIQHGADVKWHDANGNGIMMEAVQCPVPVAAKLIDAGAPFKDKNSQGFTPLAVAFAQGRWDVAELLVDRGARLSKAAIDQLFFEKPTDPKKLALVRRATAK